MSESQSIKTAPTNEYILAFEQYEDGPEFNVVKFVPEWGVDKEPMWVSNGLGLAHFMPTHWWPLPAAPEAQSDA